MKNFAINATPKNKRASSCSGLFDTPLPVISIVNYLITTTNYLSAVKSATLPSVVTSNAQYNVLVNDFNDWQYLLWKKHFQSLIHGGIVAQAEEINVLVNSQVTEQRTYASVITPSWSTTPRVILTCRDLLTLVTAGLSYIEELQAIASDGFHADTSSAELAQINLFNSRLMAIVSETVTAITAFTGLIKDWQLVGHVINSSTSNWTNHGLEAITAWAKRMSRISFYTGVAQTVS